MIELPSSEIIKIEPASPDIGGGNKVTVLVTAPTRRAAKRRGRIEAGTVVPIRFQSSISVEEVNRITLDDTDRTSSRNNVKIQTEKQEITQVKKADVTEVFSSVVKNIRGVKVGFKKLTEEQKKKGWIPRSAVEEKGAVLEPVFIRRESDKLSDLFGSPREVAHIDMEEAYIVTITEETRI